MQIKICGIKTPELAKQAVQAGAHYIGIMQHPESKRAVDLPTTIAIAEATKAVGAVPVAVFVDADHPEIEAFCEKTGIDMVQLHGVVARQQNRYLPDSIRRIYAVAVNPLGQLDDASLVGVDFLKKERDFLLFDVLKGGSGESFDWDFFQNPFDVPYFLAGGLHSKNIVDAVNACHPDGVDVSSGVEDEQGDKQIDLIKAFIAAIPNEEMS